MLKRETKRQRRWAGCPHARGGSFRRQLRLEADRCRARENIPGCSTDGCRPSQPLGGWYGGWPAGHASLFPPPPPLPCVQLATPRCQPNYNSRLASMCNVYATQNASAESDFQSVRARQVAGPPLRRRRYAATARACAVARWPWGGGSSWTGSPPRCRCPLACRAAPKPARARKDAKLTGPGVHTTQRSAGGTPPGSSSRRRRCACLVVRRQDHQRRVALLNVPAGTGAAEGRQAGEPKRQHTTLWAGQPSAACRAAATHCMISSHTRASLQSQRSAYRCSWYGTRCGRSSGRNLGHARSGWLGGLPPVCLAQAWTLQAPVPSRGQAGAVCRLPHKPPQALTAPPAASWHR